MTNKTGIIATVLLFLGFIMVINTRSAFNEKHNLETVVAILGSASILVGVGIFAKKFINQNK